MLAEKVFAKAGGSFEPIPMGIYQVLVADVNMVSQFNSFKGRDEDKLNYTLIVLDDVKCPDESSTRGRYLFKRCTNSLHEKSELYKMVKAILGRNLTKEELEGFDVESIIGKQVRVMVNQKPNKEETVIYNNVIEFTHADKDMEPVEYKAKPAVVEKSSHPVSVEEDVIDPDAEIKKLEEDKK